MGISMSTLGGWTLVLCIAGYYAFRYIDDGKKREAARAAAQRHRLEDRQNTQSRKENKEKAKRQRGETFTKEVTKEIVESDKATKPKPRSSKPANQTASYSSDEGVDNREFARQLASVKQGTNFTGPKKSDEKRQKSVKQSQAQEQDDKVSAPSSTAGADADDDQSPIASPEVHPRGTAEVSDMLERPSDGPSVLRLTDTDQPKKKEKKAKAAEKAESKKQRQNRQKVEAAKIAREEAENERKVKMEAQRRLARISEGRAAKDGSGFVASQNVSSAWAANGGNGNSNGNTTNGSFIPVQPLDTFSSTQAAEAPKRDGPKVSKADSWLSSMPSEEEQMEMLRDEEAWSTVKGKKATKGKKKASGDDSRGNETTSEPEHAAPVAPVTTKPVAAKTQGTNVNGKPAKTFTQQSSFAALTPADEPEVEEEWDV